MIAHKVFAGLILVLLLLGGAECEEGVFFISDAGLGAVGVSGTAHEIGKRFTSRLEDPRGMWYDDTNDFILYTDTAVVAGTKTTILYRISGKADTSTAPDVVGTWTKLRPFGLTGDKATTMAYLAVENQLDSGKGIRFYYANYMTLGQVFPVKPPQLGSGTQALQSGDVALLGGTIYFNYDGYKIGTIVLTAPDAGTISKTFSYDTSLKAGDVIGALVASESEGLIYASLTNNAYPAAVYTIKPDGSFQKYDDIIPKAAAWQKHTDRGATRKGVPIPNIARTAAATSTFLCSEASISTVDLATNTPKTVHAGASLGPVVWTASLSEPPSAAPVPPTDVPTLVPTGTPGKTAVPTVAPGATAVPTAVPTTAPDTTAPAVPTTTAPDTTAPTTTTQQPPAVPVTDAPPTPEPPPPPPAAPSDDDNMLMIIIIACSAVVLICICIALAYLHKTRKEDQAKLEQRMREREGKFQDMLLSTQKAVQDQEASRSPPPEMELTPITVKEDPMPPSPKVRSVTSPSNVSMKEIAIPESPESPSRDSVVYWQGLHSRPVARTSLPTHGPGSPMYQRVVAMYEVHAPNKLDTIPGLVNKYAQSFVNLSMHLPQVRGRSTAENIDR